MTGELRAVRLVVPDPVGPWKLLRKATREPLKGFKQERAFSGQGTVP